MVRRVFATLLTVSLTLTACGGDFVAGVPGGDARPSPSAVPVPTPLVHTTVPPVAEPVRTPVPTVAPTPVPTPVPVAQTYALKTGETWETLIHALGQDAASDAPGAILYANPQLRNPYDLKAGALFVVPGTGPAPVYPAFSTDFSTWKVIGTQTSRFGGSSRNRITNIINGANYVNNYFDDAAHPFMAPRGRLSLNAIIGETSQDRGYRPGFALVVVNGKVTEVPSDGGGVCQVPSTIFPAALKAGLNVLERTNHSEYPYIVFGYPEGLGWDATINSPEPPDLVVRNMYDYPVRLRLVADLAAQTLRVDVLGPPELSPYAVTIDGPYLTSPGPRRLASTVGTYKGASTTTVTQRVDVGGSVWSRTFDSTYLAAPY